MGIKICYSKYSVFVALFLAPNKFNSFSAFANLDLMAAIKQGPLLHMAKKYHGKWKQTRKRLISQEKRRLLALM